MQWQTEGVASYLGILYDSINRTIQTFQVKQLKFFLTRIYNFIRIREQVKPLPRYTGRVPHPLRRNVEKKKKKHHVHVPWVSAGRCKPIITVSTQLNLTSHWSGTGGDIRHGILVSSMCIPSFDLRYTTCGSDII